MTKDEIEKIASAIAAANTTTSRIPELPDGLHAGSPQEALEAQARVVALVGQSVRAWKVATTAENISTWGAIFELDCLSSPAHLPVTRMPLAGIEGEIAFRFIRDLPARVAPYSRQEVDAALMPFPAIEVVDSRFESYDATPPLDRMVDRMSNGGLVIGTAEAGARDRDLSKLRVVLTCNGETLVDHLGGHSKGDPMLPVMDFVHARQAQHGFATGEMITAGTLTGLIRGKKGQTYKVAFEGLGEASVTFD